MSFGFGLGFFVAVKKSPGIDYKIQITAIDPNRSVHPVFQMSVQADILVIQSVVLELSRPV